ncbi:hypothetical protein H2198_003203 [Neophaeococcomyces mojaviensis]|uniref:Uncharacterized protein n=1 Tax=Neophaeococcomyces mojaviensis TaxID=3383035 RepID=A0ACC3ACH7_9EURO|nr:hypothetical protein H2198_003203 [Knufia sp. JES_112]
MFAGRQLENRHNLSDYNVQKESTVSLASKAALPAPRKLATGTLPPTPLTESERKGGIENRQTTAAKDGDFDDDLYIVDPDAHFARLKALEAQVVTTSEWFRCRGKYDLLNDRLSEAAFDTDPLSLSSHWTGSFHQTLISYPSEHPEEQILASLRKSHLILCRISDNFQQLRKAGFCQSYYSCLTKHTGRHIAEVVKIPASLIGSTKSSIARAIRLVRSGHTKSHSNDLQLRGCLQEQCFEILDLLLRSHPSMNEINVPILVLCRMIAIYLDLALVSYMGSHGVRFDLEYLKEDAPNIRIIAGTDSSLILDCGLEQLACLDDFLDRRKVWVFRIHGSQVRAPLSGAKYARRSLTILSRMEDFADLWGPVWAIPAGEDHPNKIKQYNTSKGTICRVSTGPVDDSGGAMSCHWYSWPSFRRHQESRLLPQQQQYLMDRDDLLLIGMHWQDNKSCPYPIADFERSYGEKMGILGTSESAWKLDSRALALSFSKFGGIQLQGTQKRIPEITLKQHILDKWTNKPERANPSILNQLHGIEISHCTGNAQRITLKELMIRYPLRQILDRQIPNWDTTTWGSDFFDALRTSNPDDILKVWKTHVGNRRDMAALVCSVLETLDKTGMADDGFTAAFLHKDQDRSIDLDLLQNDWARALRDSPSTAVYAFVNEVCIECFTPDHRTATCNGLPAFTVLRTRMTFSASVDHSRVTLLPHNQYFKVVEEPSPGKLVLSPASVTRSIFPFLLGRQIQGREIRDPLTQDAHIYQVYVQASRESCSGKAHPMVRSTLLLLRSPQIYPRKPVTHSNPDSVSRNSSPWGCISARGEVPQHTENEYSRVLAAGPKSTLKTRQGSQIVTTRAADTRFKLSLDQSVHPTYIDTNGLVDLETEQLVTNIPQALVSPGTDSRPTCSPQGVDPPVQALHRHSYLIQNSNMSLPHRSGSPTTFLQAPATQRHNAPRNTSALSRIVDGIGNRKLDSLDTIDLDEQHRRQKSELSPSLNLGAQTARSLAAEEYIAHRLRRRPGFSHMVEMKLSEPLF